MNKNIIGPIAILHQAHPPPPVDGIQKPMKQGGYSDSGADIAVALKKLRYSIVTPVPNPLEDKTWVFPDTNEGIINALEKGARIFWLNTVLYEGHAIEAFWKEDIEVVGQIPNRVGVFDNKLYTNRILKEAGLPIPNHDLISTKELKGFARKFSYPLVMKPIRGRGSQGVFLVKNEKELMNRLEETFESKRFGDSVYVEQYLSGEEFTITVLPPGIYQINGQQEFKTSHWCLPAIRRFNHQNGIAPYSGKVAVMENSEVMSDATLASAEIQKVYKYCEKVGEMIEAKAPIRVDGRADENGKYFLFDVNMKPNMTGPSRPHRKGQDSLTALAARKIGWSYETLIEQVLRQKWRLVR